MTDGKFLRYSVQGKVFKELAEVDELFYMMKRDESLPTFPDFFVDCVVRGTAQQVNLEEMFPTHYKIITSLLKKLSKNIINERKNIRK